MNFLWREVPLGKFYRVKFPVLLWYTLALVAVVLETMRGSINNYYIFKQVFWHTLHQTNLYTSYPAEYIDTNHYGPFFSLVIAPFAVLPDAPGVILWSLANAAILLYAIRKLNFTQDHYLTVLLICAIEMMSSIHSVQFNPTVAAWIILSYVMVRDRKDLWATFFIAAGLLVKLYGVVGLTFFLFSEQKWKFALSFVAWSVLLFCLPMLISSPGFIVQSHFAWMKSLAEKDGLNAASSFQAGLQDISVLGMLRRIFKIQGIEDWMVLLPALTLFALPLLRWKQYQYAGFQLRYLALCLISIVIFSSSAESVTYINAVAGVSIWYVLEDRKSTAWNIFITVFFFMTVLSTTDLCPRFFQLIVRGYALKALPSFVVWLMLLREVGFKRFANPLNPAII